MDIVRSKPKSRARYLIIAGAIVVVGALSVSVSKLESRPPSVEKSTLWIDSVRRGTMLRQVRAPGTLLPEHVRIISAVTAGRVEELPIKAGVTVTPESEICLLTNPDVQLQALDAQRQLSLAQGSLLTLKQTLETQKLAEAAAVTTAEMNANEADRQVTVFESLDKKGLAGTNELAKARDAAKAAQENLQIEKDRLKVLSESIDQQVALAADQVERLKAIDKFRESLVASMHVTAGEPGVLQEMPLLLGEWVVPGTILARVAQPGKLKAVLSVPETQAKDVVIGQVVSVDTRNGIVPGRVQRIDPAVNAGTVGIDVSLEGPLPSGARADLSVDGTIEIERLDNVLYVGRPAFGQPDGTISLFAIGPDGHTAVRKTVKLGKSSVTTIEVLQGLAVGDRVIISDMSAWDNVNKVRVE
ncbi:MAG TPA: HlyD family efflux transporter periplasmic adaptor subunit [Gemmatimonadaceae bacterium]|nr:HlyD family efflux transporter periplasmic adaptor subunit [Gemmatimonadaceae bacterium]